MAPILSVREMIDAVLGSTCDENVVNFKMLQNVLHVLAQQLRVLDRQVELLDGEGSSSSIISVTEVKIESAMHSKGTAKDTMLVVDRGSTKDTDYNRSNHGRISVVTQAQFAKLEALVHQTLKHQNILPRVSSILPPNDQAIADIRHGNLSLPDIMTTMQIAGRVEATERGIQKLAELLTELASTTGMKVDDNLKLNRPIPGRTYSSISEGSDKKIKTVNLTHDVSIPTEESVKSPIREIKRKSILGGTCVQPDTDDFVTTEHFTNATKELQAEIKRTADVAEQRLRTSIDLAMVKILTLEERMSDLTRVDERISIVEKNIDEYSNDLNSLDTGLSIQISSLHEQLNELQADLEAGLQQVMESFAAGGDTAALTELSTKLASLMADFDEAATSLHILDNETKTIIADLLVLLEQIELLKRDKVDREEMIDALRDKADKRALNGMVAETYFEAVRESIASKQKSADEKFRKCENVWAGAIGNLHDELNDKAEKIQLEPLRDYLDSRLAEMLRRIQEVIKVVGEPRAAGVSRRWVRDTECIACSAPAVLKEERITLPRLPEAAAQGIRPPAIGAESPEDNKFVFHTEWPTSTHLCQRYCGGSHTMMPAGVVTRSLFSEKLKVSPTLRRVAPGEGTDGRLYMTEEMIAKRPCIPCNPPPPPGSHADTVPAATV